MGLEQYSLDQVQGVWDASGQFIGVAGVGSNSGKVHQLEKAYWGAIASRCGPPSKFTTVGESGNKEIMARSKHYAMDNIKSVKLVYANWYVNDTAPVGEKVPGASATYTASIEYPAGTIAAVLKFGGVVAGVCANGATIDSDEATVDIPKGAAFFVRTWVHNEAGIVYQSGGAGLSDVVGAVPDSGEWMTFATATADLTQSTTNVNNLLLPLSLRPTAIVGQTVKKSVFVAGDSREGWGNDLDQVTDGYGLSGQLSRSIGAAYASINCGCSSECVKDVLGAGYARRLDLAKWCSHVAAGYGINDIGFFGRTAANVKADMQAFWARFGAKPVYQATISPWTTGTFATEGGQVVNAGVNAIKNTVNDWIRKIPGGLSGVLEVADASESARNSGIWKAGYTSDGLHANNTGNKAVKAFGGVAI